MMPTIGAEINWKMSWVDHDQPIDLILDNAGGHGTRQAINEYTRQLREQYNVILRFQPPCSGIKCPGSGHLDELAVSCQMQALEQEKDAEALARTVKEAYDNLPPEMITKVFDHLPIVWESILVSNGDNVNSRREGVISTLLLLWKDDSFAPRKNMREVGCLSRNVRSKFCLDFLSP
jgi:hypothetical protein